MITLKNIATATKQEIFNQVVEHAFQMKEQCGERNENGDFICKYRHGSNKCFAGAFIADDEYDDSYEGTRWSELSFFSNEGWRDKGFRLFVGGLQVIHDEYSGKEFDGEMHEYFDKEFREFALNNELEYTPRF